MENTRSREIVLIFIAVIFAVILLTTPAFATPATEGVIDRFLEEFQNLSRGLERDLAVYARRLFWLLAFIQFAYATISLGRKGEFSFNSLIELLIREIMFIGFFWLLLSWSSVMGGSTGVGGVIVESFREMGEKATKFGKITPSTVLDKGVELAWQLIKDAFSFNVLKGLGSIFPAVIILVAFAFAAAHTAVMLIEYYIVVPVGIIMLGFGGSLWTKNYAETYLRCLLSIGVKLLCLQVVLAFCIRYLDKITLIAQGIQKEGSFVQSYFSLAGISIIIYMAVQQVPSFASSLITGSSSGSASALTGAVGAMVGAAAGAALGAAKAAGAGMDAASAFNDASDSGGDSSASQAAQLSGGGGGGESSSSPSSLPSALRGDSGGDSAGGSGGDSAGDSGGDSAGDSGGGDSAGDGGGGDSAGDGGGGDSAGDSGGGDSAGGSGGDPAGGSGGGDSAGDGGGGDSAGDSGGTKSQTAQVKSLNSQSKTAFVAKAVVRSMLGMKPMSRGMKSQLRDMKKQAGQTPQQAQMFNAMFPGA